MKQILLLMIMSTFICSLGVSQVIFKEDFEGGVLPSGWSNISNATDGGFVVGSVANLSSEYFTIPFNGSTTIIATNDDKCNCNKRNELLVTPAIDLSMVDKAFLKFDAYFTDSEYETFQENTTIEISTDGTNWEPLEDLHGHGSWDQHIINISSYAGKENIYVGFRYDDDGDWLYGLGLDNIIVEIPPALEANLINLSGSKFGETEVPVNIVGIVYNEGADIINEMELSYSINGIVEATQIFSGLEFNSLDFYNFEFDKIWIPSQAGVFDIEVNIVSVNGMQDFDIANNVLNYSIDIYEKVNTPNRIEDILSGTPNVEKVTDAEFGLNRPTDLDFFPIAGKDELWIVNQRTENAGGSTLIIKDVTNGMSQFLPQVDANSWHFMSLPTGIAFSSDNYNFATSTGVKDANHNGGTFTGPTLWSSDPDIYAQPSGGNGSHLDMLHGSPFCMGIAHEVDNAFWVYDNWNKDIVMYDFVDDHGPGNDDHSDAKVHRYKNIGINATGDIPNHLILDKNTGWLYFVDNGKSRVMRLDINSATSSIDIPLINEPLAEHKSMLGFSVETIIDEGLNKPCGIEIFENYLLVGDYNDGLVHVYDILNNFLEMGSFLVEGQGLTGIKVGHDGNIWTLNRLSNSLNIVSPGEFVATEEVIDQNLFKLTPNPTTGLFKLNELNDSVIKDAQVEIYNTTGQLIYSINNVNNDKLIDISAYNDGLYIVYLYNNNSVSVEKLTLSR